MENIRESIDFQHMLMVCVLTGRAFLRNVLRAVPTLNALFEYFFNYFKLQKL